MDYLEYIQNESEESIKNRRINANRRKTLEMMKFQIVFRRILSIFAIIQFGKKNYLRYNLSFKIHIGKCKSVENCGFYIILSYPLAFLTKLEKGDFLGTLQNGQILLKTRFYVFFLKVNSSNYIYAILWVLESFRSFSVNYIKNKGAFFGGHPVYKR